MTGVAGSSVALTLDTASQGVLASVLAGALPPQSVKCTAPSPAVTLASIPIVAPAGSGGGGGTGGGGGGSGGSGGSGGTTGVTPPTVSGVSPASAA